MPLSPENGASRPTQSGISNSNPDVKVDLTQMFVLIEGILPFEACLYYQVLPLYIEGSCLHLGMVNPKDQSAADYVRRLLSYINCSIFPHQIASDWHREILSKFLSHAAKNRPQSSESVSSSAGSPSVASPSVTAGEPSPQDAKRPSPINSLDQTIEDEPTQSPNLDSSKTSETTESDRDASDNFNEHPTLVVNFPDEVSDSEPGVEPLPSKPDQDGQTAKYNRQNSKRSDLSASDSAFIDPFEAVPATSPSPESSQPIDRGVPSAVPSSRKTTAAPLNLPLVSEPQPSSSESFESLRTLQPKALTQKLLTLVINGGIGRIYLERQSEFGRILWSKDGILQSVAEEIDPHVFQGVVNELKLMMSLSLIPVRKAKQVEIERTYEGHRILLRFRVMPGNHGEEATLQILRGAALKFYQQQQIEKLSRDALGMAHTLQQRLQEIREQARQNLDLESTQLETFPAISSLLKEMESQIDAMMPEDKH